MLRVLVAACAALLLLAAPARSGVRVVSEDRGHGYPFTGSALEIWDSGPVREDFLRIGGQVTDHCSGGPCYSRNWKGSF